MEKQYEAMKLQMAALDLHMVKVRKGNKSAAREARANLMNIKNGCTLFRNAIQNEITK